MFENVFVLYPAADTVALYVRFDRLLKYAMPQAEVGTVAA
jgi:hypothetical protein